MWWGGGCRVEPPNLTSGYASGHWRHNLKVGGEA